MSRNGKPPDIWDTHGISGNVYVNPPASSSITLSRRIQSLDSYVTEHERQKPDTALDPRCQSGPSARNSVDPKEGRFSEDCGADQQRLQISDLHLD